MKCVKGHLSRSPFAHMIPFVLTTQALLIHGSEARVDGFGVWSRRLPVSSELSGLGGEPRLRPAWRWATVLTFFRGRRHEVVGAESVHAKDISGVRWLGQ